MKAIISVAKAKACGFPTDLAARTVEVTQSPDHNLIGSKGYDVFYTVTRPVFPKTDWVVAAAHIESIIEP